MRLYSLVCAVGLAFLSAFPDSAARAVNPLFAGASQVPTLAPLLKTITPSVVSISVRARPAAEDSPIFMDPLLRELFGIPEAPATQAMRVAGSGVIMDAAQGFIVTDNHVVEFAEEISVTLNDGRSVKAVLLGGDPDTDVAVLKIEAGNLVSMPFGDSDQLEVGDFVLAIGNPFALGQTVTAGIVSALRRTGLGIEGYEDFIQTDASINPGNSGGALVNLRGELVGINAAIVGSSGGNVGIGFAIPINIVRSIAAQLVKYGSVSHGQIGITLRPLAQAGAQALPTPASAERPGAEIMTIAKGSPADHGGLKVGDIVTAIDGVPIRDMADIRIKIGLLRVGDAAEITVLRNGQPMKARTTVAAPVRRTMEGQALSPLLAGSIFSSFGSEVSSKGIVVDSIRMGSNAARAGLHAGDRIVSVNDTRLDGPDEFIAEVKASPVRLVLDLVRGGRMLRLSIQEMSGTLN